MDTQIDRTASLLGRAMLNGLQINVLSLFIGWTDGWMNGRIDG